MNLFEEIKPKFLSEKLTEGLDYTIENGLFVFTASFLKRRGYCCKNGCRNCPYDFIKSTKGSAENGNADSKALQD
jgi:primosomal protein N'